MEDLNDIVLFESSKAEAPEKAPAETGEKTATPAESKQERDETGKFRAKVETKEEPKVETKEEPPKAEKGQISALLAERSKRQTAEERARALEARIAELEKGGKKDDADFWTDPEKAIADRVQKALTPYQQRLFNASIKAAEKSHEDWEQAAENFAALLDKDPTLQARWREAEDPGEFVYEMGSNTAEFRSKREEKWKSDLSAKDARIAELEARLAEAEKSKTQLSDVPESLNRQPSGSQPARADESSDLSKIVRFQY